MPNATTSTFLVRYSIFISGSRPASRTPFSCLTRQQYRFTYDYANRLLTANHYTHNGTSWVNTNNYSENNITYDLNGNIKTYTRRGLTAPAIFGVIDQLTYTYGDAARPDRLTNMAEAGSTTKGFVYTAGAAAYQYDANGNLTQDNHKGLSFQYNYLNLPNYYSNVGGADVTLTHTADGEKLSKVSSAGTRNYVSGIEYLNTNLDAIYHAEGRCTPNGSSAFYYEYTIKDHLGNARINFRANGAAVTFLQELHYYPFGMLMEGIGTAKVTDNGYKYNGKELNEDLGLNWSDYGARWYDAAVGRWWSVDPMGEKFGPWSVYNYGVDNPIRMKDPDGMQVVDPDGNEICFDQEKKEWSENATEDVKKVGNAMMSTEAGAAAYIKMENTETVITITLTDKPLPEGYGFTVSKGKTESGEPKTSDITISTDLPEEGRYKGASEEEYLNGVGTHESVHATASGEQRKLDSSRKTRNDLYTAEVKPMNAEYDTRTQYVEKQGRSTDAIRNSYENPPPNAGRPAYYGLDSNGNPRTKSRYEK